MTSKDITNQLWDYAEQDKTKIGQRVYKWLGYDLLNSIILDGEVFWLEYNTTSSIPEYVFTYIKKWGNNQNYTYLYDLK